MATINGDNDPNVLNDTPEGDTIDAMGGDDTITVTAGIDYVFGGAGNDTLIVSYGSYSSSYYVYGGFTANSGGGYDGAYNGGPFVQFNSIENFQITFGSGNDGISVGNGNDIVNLGSGDDYVDIGSGNDNADGGLGVDGISADLSSVSTNVSWNLQTSSLSGSAGDSFVNFEYFGTVTLGNGNDTIVSGLGGYNETINGGGGSDSIAIFGGSDHILGGVGTDTAVIRWAAYNNGIYNYGGINPNGTLGGYDGAFNGGPYMDYSSVERFDIETGGGNDSIVTADGNDIVKTNGGDDYVDVGTGTDSGDGGLGNDGVSAHLGEATSAILWNLQTNVYSGGPDSFTNFEYFGTITTGSGNDVLVTGNGGNSEIVYAGLGDDTFTTVNGSDTFYAGKGNDRLIIDFSAAGGGIYNYGGVNPNAADGGFDGGFNGNGLISYNSVEHFTITTGSGGDSITTATGNDIVSTGSSDDYVDVGSGTDTADGGTGKDGISADLSESTLAILWNLQTNSYSGGPDSFANFEWFGTVMTGSGNDVLVTTNLFDNEIVYTGIGDDRFTTVNGSDTFYAGAGIDTLIIDFAAATGSIYNYGGINPNAGLGGYDGAFNGNGLVSYNSVENFIITTGLASDYITTATGNDVVSTNGGDDFVDVGSGVDTADGGLGSDQISANLSDATAAILWNLRTNSYSGGSDSFTNFEYFGTVSTGSGNDRLVTGNGNNAETIYAGQGDDVVTVTNGSDTVFGEKGVDTLIIDFSAATGGIYNYGGINPNAANGGFDGAFNGNGLASYNSIERFDITTGLADDNITTGDGDDIIDGGAANDTLNAAAGFDTASYASATAGVTVNLSGPALQDTVGAGVDTLYNFENLLGSAQADTLTGDARNNIISGGLGGDLLNGGDGSDALLGGEGTNTLNGGTGNDLLGGSTIVGPDLIVNGGFEMVDLTTTSQAFVQAAPNDYNGATYRFTGTLLGWQTNGTAELNIASSNPGFVPGEGKASLDMEVDPGQNKTIYQDVAGIAAGTELLVTFSAALPTGGSLGANPTGVLQVVWNGVVVGTVSPTSTVAEQFTFVVNAAASGSGAGGANRLEFREIGSGADARGTILDDVSLKALAGGSGVDTMIGGIGDDVYLVTAGDTITENADEGTDSVRTALASYTLGANLENLAGTSLTGQTLTGNAVANAITGNAGNDTIDGGGANDVLSGGTGNDTLIGGSGDDSMAGGKGDDVYSGVEAGDTISENADEGTDEIRTALASYTLGTNFENLTGTSASGQTLTGNSVANVITGAGGNDVIDGGAGIDTMAGGGGNDRYVVDVAGDVVTELAGGGTDTIETALASYSIASLVNVENLTGTSAIGQTLTGNTGANVITGGSGNDVIDGGAGSDTMIGGLGDDTYSIDNATDAVTEALNAGTDTIRTNRSALNLLNFANVENLIGTVNTGQTLTGNALANTITAGSGNDTLDGGAGNDTLIGGVGNDTYTVDSVGDVVTELAGQGTDTLRTTLASFSLTSVANIENLTGLSAGGQTLTGNGGANTVTGAGGNDVIDGGAGIDTMIGGAGNDLYRVDVAGDVVTEGAGAGSDTIETALATYSLAALANVENLTGTSASGQTLTGNATANVITGGSGSDVIDGGAGIDTMIGGLGDDSYAVRDAGDIVTEAADAGTDSVTAYIASYTLGDNVETLIGGLATGQTLTGNTLSNRIVGGAGADTLAGGLGNDVYVVDNAGDAVGESAGEGTDTVEASVSYALAANVENITLTGAAAINATGNADANVLIGNSGNNRLDGGAGADSMSGGLGNDTYVVDAGDTVAELLNGGTDTVETAMSYTLGANLENLVLTGTAAINGTGNALDNVITGTGRANELVGLDGNDRLDGGLGIDKLTGGLGDDTYVVDNASDVITELANEGNDTVESSISFSLAGRNIETLRLIGAAAIGATGSSGADALYGNSAANTLNGGLGADRMEGGLGNDKYVVDDAGDLVVEASGAGTDLVTSSITYVLGEFLENLTLSGTAAIDGTGNALANIITGNAGDNNLDGAAGADTMQGGNGNDHYVVDDAGDKIVEANGQGGDTVDASVTFSLAGQYLEALNLTGTAAINGSGNSLDNRIIGNSAVNTLNGAAGNDRLDGGLGADKLTGGVGNDTYVVDNAGDLITELNGEGTDTVEASISYSLAGQFIETLKLTGTGNINGTGNGLANTMTGNSGNNTLNGGGGADSLSGGTGNDRYIVDDANDKVFELTGEGTDLVESSVTFTLAGQFIENLTLTGSAAVDGTGNGLTNLLTGNGAANKLNGGTGDDALHGGFGSDTLTGGTGLDDFWFETTLGAGNVDAITDFKAADDTIHLDRTIFSAILTDGALSTAAFYQGSAAHDADDRIIYNKVTGQLYYDADGTGAGAAILFATVTANTALTAADFITHP